MGVPSFNEKSAAGQDLETGHVTAQSPHSPTPFMKAQELDYEYASQNAQNRHFRQINSRERCKKYCCPVFIIFAATACAILFACALSVGYYIHRHRNQAIPKDDIHKSASDPHQWIADAPVSSTESTTTVKIETTSSESTDSGDWPWFRSAKMNNIDEYDSFSPENDSIDSTPEASSTPGDYQDYYETDAPSPVPDEEPMDNTETDAGNQNQTQTQSHSPLGFWDLVNLMRKATRGEIRRVRIRFNMHDDPSQSIDN